MKVKNAVMLAFVTLFQAFVIAQDITKEEREEWVSLIKGGEIQTIEGLLCMNPYDSDKVGCIDSSGTTIVPFKYDFIQGFYNGLAAVNIGGEYVQQGYPKIKGGKWGIIDKTGKEITSLKYDYIEDVGWFGDLIPVGIDGKKGLINREGRKITPIKYDNISRFDNESGLWVVSIKDSVLNNMDTITYPDIPHYLNYSRKGLVDHTGEITPIKYNVIVAPFTDNLTMVGVIEDMNEIGYLPEKYGFINREGKEVVPPKYYTIEKKENYEEGHFEYFQEGLALVSVLKEDGRLKFGYIDRTGKEVIPLKFDDANEFNEGKAEVEIDYDTFYINKKGERIDE